MGDALNDKYVMALDILARRTAERERKNNKARAIALELVSEIFRRDVNTIIEAQRVAHQLTPILNEMASIIDDCCQS